MKSNELRVGNWVSTKYKELSIIKITEIRESVIYSDKNGISYSSLLPIPLTEEILFKCGFKWNESWGSYILNGLLIEKIDNLLCERRYGICLKNMHQLQNLYFALTNNELEIEL